MVRKERFITFINRSSILFILVVIWVLSDALNITNTMFIPHFNDLVINTIALMQTTQFWSHIWSSVQIIIGGFILSAIVAIPFGLLMGYLPSFYALFDNLIELVRPLSPLALYPLFIYLFGIGYISKLAIVFWVSWIPILLNTVSGVRHVPAVYLQLGKIYKANTIQMFKEIIVPAILPNILVGARLAMGSALLVIVAAEMIGSSKGLGFFILNASQTFKITNLYSGILVIGILGVIINTFFISLEKHISRYR